MKHLIRRMARVEDALEYEQLRPRKERRRAAKGLVPLDVGREMERFEVGAELLGRPALAELLRRSEQKYGFEYRGPIRIPCPVPLFRRIIQSLVSSGGLSAEDEEELLRSKDEDLGPRSAC